MALPNILGLYILAPVVKEELQKYRAVLKGFA
jgi:Na+/alanine symporter